MSHLPDSKTHSTVARHSSILTPLEGLDAPPKTSTALWLFFRVVTRRRVSGNLVRSCSGDTSLAGAPLLASGQAYLPTGLSLRDL